VTRAQPTATPADAGTILVVEDDRSLRDGLAMNFQLRGYRVLAAADGEAGARLAVDERPDLIVLDLMLPGLDGFEVLGRLRGREIETPVLILSARGQVADKVEGFRLGADDYLTKPFQLPELIARVEVMLRRSRKQRAAPAPIVFGEIEIDSTGRRVRRCGREVALLAKEFDLLCLLARSPGRAFTREAILERVWGWDFDGTTRTVDNYILALRQKLEKDPARPRHIKTVRQVGYKLDS
jgi:two-component system, OmpR family, alkaline phosphatase synthesis response regulator PhoP